MKTNIKLGAAALLLWGAGIASAGAQERTIGITIPNLGSSFWISAVYGLQSEAQAQGYKVVTLDAGNLLSDLNTHPPACDSAPGFFLGLSFAGWNVVASLLFAVIGWYGAFAKGGK